MSKLWFLSKLFNQMASSSNIYRNNNINHRNAIKIERTPASSSNLRASSSFKSKLTPSSSNVRRSTPAFIGGSSRPDDSGLFSSFSSYPFSINWCLCWCLRLICFIVYILKWLFVDFLFCLVFEYVWSLCHVVWSSYGIIKLSSWERERAELEFVCS